jgi:hypothetical protein
VACAHVQGFGPQAHAPLGYPGSQHPALAVASNCMGATMGLFGKLIGWDQQKDAHNAVLANYVAETASPQLKKEIVERLIIIQQRVTGGGRGDPHAILADLCDRPRIVQMNFIALACNNLGIPSGLNGLSFMDVQNPYHAQNDSSLNRIVVSLKDLSRRSGRNLNWPGNDVRIDFLAWAGSSDLGGATTSFCDGSSRKVRIQNAADLAEFELLMGIIDRSRLEMVADEYFDMPKAQSDHELALVTALFIFEQEVLIPHLREAQMMARLVVFGWLEEGKVAPDLCMLFENNLYKLYK